MLQDVSSFYMKENIDLDPSVGKPHFHLCWTSARWLQQLVCWSICDVVFYIMHHLNYSAQLLIILIHIFFAYHEGLLVHRLHHHHVSGLINPADWGLQLHSVSQVFSHKLTDLTGATHKLPLLRRWTKTAGVSLRGLVETVVYVHLLIKCIQQIK